MSDAPWSVARCRGLAGRDCSNADVSYYEYDDDVSYDEPSGSSARLDGEPKP